MCSRSDRKSGENFAGIGGGCPLENLGIFKNLGIFDEVQHVISKIQRNEKENKLYTAKFGQGVIACS